jgi:HEAT repeat protein
MPTLDDLVKRLASDDAEEREEALEDIDLLDEIPEPAVHAVTARLNDPATSVRKKAAEVLATAKSPLALEPLLAALERAKQHPRWGTEGEVDGLFEAIGVCCGGEPHAVMALAANLVIADPPGGRGAKYSANSAFEALARLGPQAASAVPVLLEITRDADAWRRAQAHGTLLAITGNAAAHVPPLVELLDHAEGGGAAGAGAKIALRRFGAPGLPFLREAMAHPRQGCRDQVAQLIAGIEERARRG